MGQWRRWFVVVVVAVAVMGCLTSGLANAATIYVDASQSDDNGDGTDWTEAKKSLQSALALANSGDEVWVAGGTYYPSVEVGGTGDRYKTFQMKNGVGIYGGFAGSETSRGQRNWSTNVTTLSGDIFGNGSAGAYHVFYHPDGLNLNNTAILDGFTITAGWANGSLTNGGGMYNHNSSPALANCTFSSNRATYGGGMYNHGSSPTLTNCTFSGNVATYGGGMCSYTVSSPNLTNCTFSGNTATHGGGMYNELSNLSLTNCTFSSNNASSYGGGMRNNRCSPSLTNCTFLSNNANTGGGGIYNNYSSPSLTNCTFSSNTAGAGGGMNNYNASSPSLKNCILWGNTNGEIVGSCTVTYSCVQGGYGGTGNISDDPKFVNAPTDLHLLRISPCIGAGTGTGAPSTDIEGNQRPNPGGTNPDMGAYENPLGTPNRVPTDITLSNNSVSQSDGANAIVGTLTTTDLDTGDTHIYSLVSGTGDTHNGSFNISGDTLRANDASAMSPGDYSVRIQTDDGADGTYAEAFTITVVDDDPVVTLSLSASSIVEADTSITITAHASGNDMSGTTVNLSYSGTATGGGTDYTGPTSITIPNGSSSATATLNVKEDTIVEADETVVIDISSLTNGIEGTPNQVTLTIEDDDTAQLDIAATATHTENGGSQTVAVTLTTSGGSLEVELTADVVDAGGGSATSGTDYTALGTQTVTFAAGSHDGATQTINVIPADDTRVEGDETVNLTLQNLSPTLNGRASLGTTASTVTIDDDDTAQLDIAATATHAENGGIQTVTVTLTTSGGNLGVQLTADVVDAGGSATSGADYTALSTQTVTFGVGNSSGTTQTISVDCLPDTLIEGNETLNLTLQNLNSDLNGQASLGTTASTVTITDNNDAATVAFDSSSSIVAENNTTHTIDVGLSTASGDTLGTVVTVDVNDALSGTATWGGTDYTFTSPTTVTFGPGSGNGDTQSATVTITDDDLIELDETANFGLSSATGPATIDVPDQHTLTITDDDEAIVEFQLTSGTVAEDGTSQTVTVELTTASGDTLATPVTVDVDDLGSGTAAAGGTDYTYSNTTVTFPVGSGDGATQTVTVNITDDTLVEGNETVNLQLANLTGPAVIGTDDDHTLTIDDDDTAQLNIAATATYTEGSGSPTVAVTLTTSGGNLGVELTADVVDAGSGSATSGADYDTLGIQTVTFAAGSSGGTQAINVVLTDDAMVELDETINLTLQNLSDDLDGQASLGTTASTVTITNNDSATLSIDDVSEIEGTGLEFTVTLSAAVDTGVSVDYDTADNTATTGDSDYTANTGNSLNFTGNAGETQTFTVSTATDDKVELDETLYANLSNVSASGRDVTIARSQGIGTITNDDDATVSIGDVSGAETDSGTTTLTFTVSLNYPVDAQVTVDVSTADVTATLADSDYVQVSNRTITFAAGDQSETTTVTVNGDLWVESDETFNLNLGNLQNNSRDVSLGSNGGGTITNDDQASTYSGSISAAAGSFDIKAAVNDSIPTAGTTVTAPDFSVATHMDTQDGDIITIFISGSGTNAAIVFEADDMLTTLDDRSGLTLVGGTLNIDSGSGAPDTLSRTHLNSVDSDDVPGDLFHTANPSVLAVAGDLRISAGDTLQAGSDVFSVSGTADVDGTLDVSGSATHVLNTVDMTGGTLASSSGTPTIQCSTNWTTGGGTLPATSNDWTLELTNTGNVSYTLDGPGSGSFSTLKKTGGGTATLGSGLVLDDNLDIDAGTVATGGNDLGVGGTASIDGTLSSTGGTLNFDDTVAIGSGGTLNVQAGDVMAGGHWNNSGTFTAGTSTVTFDGGGDQDLFPDGDAFYNLILSNGGGTLVLQGTLQVGNDLTLTGGTLAENNNDITLNGGLLVNVNGRYADSSGTLRFSNSSNKDWTDNTGGQSYGAVLVSSEVTLKSAVMVDTLTIAAGSTVNLDGTSAITLSVGTSITNNGTLKPINTSGNVTIQASGASFAFTDNDIDYNGRTIKLGKVDYDPDVSLGNSEGITLVGAGTFDGLTTATGASFSQAANTLTLGGDVTLADGTFTKATGTEAITFDASVITPQSLNAGNNNIGDMVVNAPGRTVQLTHDLTAETILVQAGTFDMQIYSVTVEGDFDNTGGTITMDPTGVLTMTSSGDLGGAGSSTFGQVVVPTGVTLTLVGDVSVTGLEVQTGGTLTLGTNTLTVTGVGTGANRPLNLPPGTTLTGTVIYAGVGTATMGTVYGNLVIPNGMTAQLSEDSGVTGYLDIQSGGTLQTMGYDFTVGDGVGADTITNNGMLQTTGGAGTLRLNDPYSGTGTLALVAGATFQVADNLDLTGGTFTHNDVGTVFDGATDLTTAGAGFAAITVNGTKSVSLLDGLTTTGLAVIGTLTTGDNSVDANGDVTINGGGTLNASGQTTASEKITVSGNWANSGTFTPSANSTNGVEFDGTSDATLNPGGSAFQHFTINKSHGTNHSISVITNDLQANGNLNIIDGDLTSTAQDTTIDGSTTVASGSELSSTSGKITLGSGVVTNNGVITTVTGEIESGSGAVSNNATGTISTTGAGTLDFDSNVTSTGTFTIHSSTAAVTFAAHLDLSGDTAFTHNGVLITFDGTTDLTTDSQTFPDVTLNSTVTLLDDLTLEAGENLAVPAGSTFTTGSHVLTVPGTTDVDGILDISGTATHVLATVDLTNGTLWQANPGDQPTIQCSTNWNANNATLPSNPWILELTGAGVYAFGTPAGSTHATLRKTGAGTATLGADVALSGDLDIDTGELSTGNALTVNGSTTVASGTTLTISGTGAANFGDGVGSDMVTLNGTLASTSMAATALTFDCNGNGDSGVSIGATGRLHVTGSGDIYFDNASGLYSAGDIDITDVNCVTIIGATQTFDIMGGEFGALTVLAPYTLTYNSSSGGQLMKVGGTTTVESGALLQVTGDDYLWLAGVTAISGQVTLSGPGTIEFDQPVAPNDGGISSTGTGTLDFDALVTIDGADSLIVGANSTVRFFAGLTQTGGTLVLDGAVVIDGNGTLNILTNTIGSLSVSAGVTLIYHSTTPDQTLTVSGTTTLHSPGAVLDVTGDHNLVLAGDTDIGAATTLHLSGTGEIEFGSGNTLTLDGAITSTNTGTLDFWTPVSVDALGEELSSTGVGGLVQFRADLFHNGLGTLDLVNADVDVLTNDVWFDITSETVGTLDVITVQLTYDCSSAADQVLTVTGPGSVNSSLVVSGNDHVVYQDSFTLGTGDSVTVQDNASVQFGDDAGPDVCTLDGTLTSTSSGATATGIALIFDCSGPGLPAPGVEFTANGRLDVSGSGDIQFNNAAGLFSAGDIDITNTNCETLVGTSQTFDITGTDPDTGGDPALFGDLRVANGQTLTYDSGTVDQFMQVADLTTLEDNATIDVTGDDTLIFNGIVTPGGGSELEVSGDGEMEFDQALDPGTTIRTSGGGNPVLDFDGDVTAAVTFDLQNTGTVIHFEDNVNLPNITFPSSPLSALTQTPAVIFDGNSDVTSGAHTWPDVRLVDGDGNLSSTVMLMDDFIVGTPVTPETLVIEQGTMTVAAYMLQVNGETTIGTNALAVPPSALDPLTRSTDSTLSMSGGTLDFNDTVTAGSDGLLTVSGGTVTFNSRYVSQGFTTISESAVVTAETTRTVAGADPWQMIDGTLGTFIVTQGIELDIEATHAGYTITMQGGATVESATLRLADVGDLTIQKELNFNNLSVIENIGTGTLTIEPNLTIIPGAQFLNSGGGKIVFAHVFNDSTINLSTSSGVTFQKLTNKGIINVISSAEVEGTLINVGTIYIGDASTGGSLQVGELDMEGEQPTKGLGTLIFSDRTDNLLIVEGDILITGTFAPGQSTVRLTGSGVLSDKSNTFYNLEVTGGTRTLVTDLHVLNDLAVGASFTNPVTVRPSVFECAEFEITVGGDTYLASVPVGGDGPSEALMRATGGKHSLGGAVNVGAQGHYNNNGYAVDVTVGGTLTNAGIVNLGSAAVSVYDIINTGQLTATPDELSISRGGGITNTGVFNANGGTVVFTDTGIFTPGGSEYHHVVKRGTGTATTLMGDLAMTGALTIESGMLNAGLSDIHVAGNVSVQDSLIFAAGDLVLRPSVGTTQTFDPGAPTLLTVYNDVIKRGDGVTQLVNHELILTTHDVGLPSEDPNGLLIDAGTFEMGSQDVTILTFPTATNQGTLTVSDTATLKDDTGTLTVAGLTTIEGTFTTSDAATHRFNGDPASLDVDVGGIYDNGTQAVTVYAANDVTNAGTMTLGSGDVEINGALTNSNILTATSGTLKVVSADLDNGNTSAVFNHNNGTLLLAGDGTFTPGNSVLNHITKTGANTTTSLAANANLNALGTLTVESGTFDVAVGGNASMSVGSVAIGPDALLDMTEASNVLRVAGDFTNGSSLVGFDQDGAPLFLSGTGTFTPGPAGADYDGNLFTQGDITLASGSRFEFAGTTWTNTGDWNAGTNTTVAFTGTGNQTLTTGGAPNVPAMGFVNIETDNDDTITFATQINLSGKLSIAGNATVRDMTPGSIYQFSNGAEVNVSGTWTVTGSASERISLLGPVTPDANGDGIPDDDPEQRWRLVVNSSGTVNLNYVNLLSSELITHGGSINGKNVGNTVESFGNLSPSWGPFDPAPIPSDLLAQLSEPKDDGDTPQAMPGDADGDGWVSLADFSILAATFGESTDLRADFDHSGLIDLADFSILAANFGQTSAVLAAPTAIESEQSLLVNGHWSVVGDTASVVLKAESTPLSAYSFCLDYDHDALELVDVIEGDALTDTLFVARDDGRVLSASRADAGRGTLVMLRFQVRAKHSVQNHHLQQGQAEMLRPYDGHQVVLHDMQVIGEEGLVRQPDLTFNLRPAIRNLQPEHTRLLANYPNPFNPETWIPFELADDVDVRLSIFDVSGHLVRTLELGPLPAGRYVDASSAVYWDGRNGMGERVGSGIYFYRMTAGKVSAMRRMVILE